MTTNQGVIISDNQNPLRANPRGPALLEDFILREKITHFDHERTPERIVHARATGVHGFFELTYRLVSAAGESTFVKFHWCPKLGLRSTIWDETVKVAGADQDFHRGDMLESISAGDFPEWEFAVQLFTQEQAYEFSFDDLDETPLKVIGRMVLHRWPNNFFAETESVT